MLTHLGSPSGVLPAGSVSHLQESQGGLGKVHGVQPPAPFLLQGMGPSSSSEPPEKERRRLKESFENYRRKRALRKAHNSWRQDEGDRENTTGSDNTDTEGS